MNNIHILFLSSFLILSNLSIGQSKDELKLAKKIQGSKIVDLRIEFQDSIKSYNPIDFSIIIKTKKGKEFISTGIVNKMCFDVLSGNATINDQGQLVIKKHDLNPKCNFQLVCKNDSIHFCDTFLILNYKGNLVIDYSGENGENGENGIDGDKIKKESGQNGGNGKNGKKGGDGKNINVFTKTVFNNELQKDLLVFKVVNAIQNTTNYYYADTQECSIIIKVSGGNGGNGGRGGYGGKGEPSKMEGSMDDKYIRYGTHGNHGGYGGNVGNAGQGGDCGSINLFFSPESEKYKSLIELEFYPGAGGKGGLAGERGLNGDIIYNHRRLPNNDRFLEKIEKDKNIEQVGLNGVDGYCDKVSKIVVSDLDFEIP